MSEETAGQGNGLIDLTEFSLGDLETLGNVKLATAIRRVIEQEDAEQLAEFQASI